MADGATHRKATKRNLKILGIPGALLVLLHPACIGFLIGMALGHILTPDIDHHWKTIEEHRIYRRSRVVGFLWSVYWWPYQYFHKHRGRSHRRVTGTLGRLVYLLWLPLCWTVSLGPTSWVIWLFWGTVLLGWLIQDDTHLRLDRLVGRKRKRKNDHNSRRRRYKNYCIPEVESCSIPILER